MVEMEMMAEMMGGDGGGDGRDVGDARTVTEYKKCAQVTMSRHR